MFQFTSSDSTRQLKKRKFKMGNIGDRFLRWYHRYFTEVTWFLIGNLSVQIANALTKRDYVEVLWCAAFVCINYWIWKRNQ